MLLGQFAAEPIKLRAVLLKVGDGQPIVLDVAGGGVVGVLVRSAELLDLAFRLDLHVLDRERLYRRRIGGQIASVGV